MADPLVQADKDKAASQRDAVEKVKRSLGECQGMGGLAPAIGPLLDTLVPADGDQKKVSLDIMVAINPAVKVGTLLEMELSRDNGKVKAKIGGNFKVRAEKDLWIAEVFAQASLGGYLETQGDNGAECIRLFTLAVHDAISAISTRAASYMFDEDFEQGVVDKMGKEDYYEAGLTGSVGVGLADDLSDPEVGGEVGVNASVARKRTKKGSSTESKIGGKMKLANGPWSGELGVNINVGSNAGELSFQLDRTTNILDFANDVETGALKEHLISWVGGTIGQVQGLLAGTSGLEANVGGGRNVGALLSLASSSSLGVQVGGAALARKLKDSARLQGSSMKQKLDIKIKWENGKATLDIQLHRGSELKFGGDVKAAKLEVIIENLQRMIKIPTITLCG
ncbi:MAG: hypothetical protein HN348_14930 [Proteobacteria bacterium]|nr:hypothetical protein [Pseudomonadota bacterium]